MLTVLAFERSEKTNTVERIVPRFKPFRVAWPTSVFVFKYWLSPLAGRVLQRIGKFIGSNAPVEP